MKTKISILVLVLCSTFFSTLSNAQGVWELQNPLPACEDLLDVYSFPNSSTAWISGYYGTILKTVDAGNNWTKLISGTTNDLNAIQFITTNIGWVVGNTGTILKTTNGGVQWFTQTSGTTNNLTDVYFVDENTGWAVGWSGTILKTTNGGSTWIAQTSGFSLYIYSVHFENANIGWAVGYSGKVLKTINGGNTWAAQTSGTGVGLYSVYFYNTNIGWVVGNNGVMLKTTNGGTNWASLTSGTTNSINSVFFTDQNNGCAVDMNGYIYKTNNGGTTWTSQTIGTTFILSSINFTTSNIGWFVGTKGNIYKTTDGGTIWISQTSGPTNDLYDAHFIDANVGWVAGNSGILLKTTNGGSTWATQASGTINGLYNIYFYDSNTAWLVGSGGTILKTINGGTSWVAQASGTSEILYDVRFTNGLTAGWIVGTGGKILKTLNGGTNWVPQTSGTTYWLRNCYFTDSNTGWAVGYGGTILKTTNGGTNWITLSSGTTSSLYFVFFIDSNTGWAMGNTGTILKTTNGGTNWMSQTSGTTNQLMGAYFLNADSGWIFDIHGGIYKTIDGGSTWTLQTSSFTSNSKVLQSSYFFDINHGWEVGPGGIITYYTNYSPASQASSITITNTTYQSLNVSWTRGNGNQCALFAKQTNTGTCTPDVNITYLPNSTFGSGDQIGSTGWYCVYNGSGTSASISGLQANTPYRFQVCEYNFSPDFTHYNLSTTTNNPLSVTTSIAPPQITVNPGDRTLCEPLNTTFSVTASGSGLSYQWQVDEGSGYINVTNGGVYSGCTTSTLSLSGIPAGLNGYKYHCVVTNTSGSASSPGALLTVNPLPVIPTEITGAQIVCLNNIYTYIVPIIQNATSYEWTYPAGFSGSSTSNTIDLTTGSNAVTGIISVKGKNSCGSGPVKNFSVSVKNLPANASQITGLNSVCTGSINIGYSITPLSDADYYLWSLPLGATGTSSINSIMVSFGTNPVSDQITVKGHNICGDGMQSVLPVSVNTVPAAIGTISGISNVCKNQNNVLFSINAIPNATSYAWTLPAGITGSNSTNSVSLNIGPDAFSGDLKVTGVNSCGVGAEIVFPVIVDAVPEALSPITGSDVVCRGQTNVQYSVAKSDRATSYVWDLPDGSSETTLTNKIVLNFDNSSSSGNLNVTPYNSCGAGNSSSLYIDVSVPPSPTISPAGDTEFCSGENVQLSISPINNVNYQWLRDGGMIGENSNAYTANVAGTYTITVTNSNGCSSTSLNSISVIVNSVPQVSAVSLSGPTTFCSGGSITLSTPLTSGYSYNWRNEAGLISGANTNSYQANTSGSYQLDISNSSGCIVKTLPVNVVVKPMPIKPAIDPGNYQPGKCMGENPIRLNVSQAVTGYSYQWYKNGIPMSNATSSSYEAFLSQGDYSIEADLSGCKVQSDLLNVFFENAPEKPLIYAEGSNVWYLACSNDSASQYKWYYNGALIQGADKYIYVANRKLGRYNVSIANAKGCFTISDAITIPTGITGIKDIDPFAGLKIYPNPTPGLFTIEMENQLFGDLLINILTQEGKNILRIKFEKTTIHFSSQIDLSGQSKGMYLINLLIDKYLANRKVIVE